MAVPQQLRSKSDGMETQTPYGEIYTLPPLCFTCSKGLQPYKEPISNLMASGMKIGEAMKFLGINRVCCQGRILNPPVLPAGQYIVDPCESIGREEEMMKDLSNPYIGSTSSLLNTRNSREMPSGNALLALRHSQKGDVIVLMTLEGGLAKSALKTSKGDPIGLSQGTLENMDPYTNSSLADFGVEVTEGVEEDYGHGLLPTGFQKAAVEKPVKNTVFRDIEKVVEFRQATLPEI